MSDLNTIVSFIRRDLEILTKAVTEMTKTHAQVLTEEWIEGIKVALVLKIGKRKLQSLRDNGALPYSQIDGKIYYKTSDVEALLNANYNKK